MRKHFVIGFCSGLLFAVLACSSGPNTCGPDSCSGCCASDGACVTGDQQNACGRGGESCNVCTADAQTCSSGACTNVSNNLQDSGTPDSGSTAFSSYSEFRSARVTALCELAVRCGAFATLQGCAASAEFAANAGLPVADVNAAIKDQRAGFDGAAARRCVDAINSATCATVATLESNADCAASLKGTVAVGGNCFIGFECAAGSWCNNPSALTCPSQCAAQKDAGQDATQSDECFPGDFLDSNSNTCAHRVAVGQSCAGSGNGGFPIDLECVSGAYCDENKVCQALKSVGANCVTSQECAAPYACRGGKCSTLGGLDAGCSLVPPEPCQLDLVCDAPDRDQPGHCVTALSAGKPCYDTTQCAKGLACRGYGSPDGGSCQTPGALDAGCEPFVDGECSADAYCDFNTTTCSTRNAVGEACVQGSCVEGATCGDTNVCELPYCFDKTP